MRRFLLEERNSSFFQNNNECFLPFINERNSVGRLLGKSPRQELQSSVQKIESATAKSRGIRTPTNAIRTLAYLLSKNQADLSQNQICHIERILNQCSSDTLDESCTPVPEVHSKRSKFIQKQPLKLNRQISKSPHKRLTKKQPSEQLSIENLNIDLIKPKKVTNIVISTRSRNLERVPQQRNATPPRFPSFKKEFHIDEDQKMYLDMLNSINQTVRREQKFNLNKNLLYPNKHVSVKPIDGNFAVNNLNEMKSKTRSFQKGRKHLMNLQKKMEDIIYYRRFGEERDLEDDINMVS